MSTRHGCQTAVARTVSGLGRAYRSSVWLVSPGAKPGPGFYKRWLIRRYARQARTPVLVETGTLHGKTVASCLNAFDSIISVEIDPDLARLAIERFDREPRVSIVQGDSTLALPDIVACLESP